MIFELEIDVERDLLGKVLGLGRRVILLVLIY